MATPWLGVAVATCSLFIATLVFFWNRKVLDLPTINKYSGDLNDRRAIQEFMTNAKDLIDAGVAKYNGPFKLKTNLGDQIILPSDYATWLRDNDALDHQAIVASDFFAYYPGFEAQKVIVDPHKALINVVKAKLSQNLLIIAAMQEQLKEILQRKWTDEKEWHDVDWTQDGIQFIALMSSVVFVGPELALNKQWQDLTLSYTANVFGAVRVLRSWPQLLRPIVHWFLPQCQLCRAQIKNARRMIRDMLRCRGGQPPPATCIQYMAQAGADQQFDPADSQLALSIAAIHTTSELLKQVILDICEHPELVQPLREEIAAAITEKGWTTAGLYQMQLLDSVIKESLRLKPGALVNLGREAIRSTTLPNGLVLPKGTHVGVASSSMWSSSNYTNPLSYNGFRFLKQREADGAAGKNSAAQLVSTSPEHLAFGTGKALCPGRFFVASEVKVAVAYLLMRYDIRLKEGSKPKIVLYGLEMMTDPTAKLEVRRRVEQEVDM